MPLLMMGGAMILGGLSSAHSANVANKSSAIDYMNSLKGNVAQNKAIEYANLQNTIRTGYKEGILNAQKGQAKLQAIQQGYDISKQGVQMLGTNQANAAAAGTIGASVDAVTDNINQKIDTAKNENDSSWELMSFNFDTQLNDLVASGMDALQMPVMGNYNGPRYQNATAAAVGGAIQQGAGFAMQYASASMKLSPQSASTRNLSSTLTPQRGLSGSGVNLPSVGGGYAYSPQG